MYDNEDPIKTFKRRKKIYLCISLRKKNTGIPKYLHMKTTEKFIYFTKKIRISYWNIEHNNLGIDI